MKKPKENLIHINSGKYKNQKIYLPLGDTTRSTKSILKNSFFNSLAYDIMDKDFVEVFGGSGSIGLEALSRGASKAYFIENDTKSFSILRKNTTNIDKINSYIIFGDTFIELPKLLKRLTINTVFYFDPPFDYRDGMNGIYEKVYALISNLNKQNTYLIAIEHLSTIAIPEQIGDFNHLKTKKFGKSAISYFN